MADKFRELDDKYYEMFDDYFPSFQLGPDEDKIQQCIDAGKDAYELFDLKEDVNYQLVKLQTIIYYI